MIQVRFCLQFLVITLQVSATDKNKGENGVVDYTILSFRDDLTQDFTIEKVDGSGKAKLL